MGEKELSIPEALKFAVSLQNSGNLVDAKKIYEKILVAQPENSEALHLLGLVYFAMKDSSRAIELIEKAIEARPNFANYHGNLGMVYDSVGREKDAVIFWENALQLDPNYGKARDANYNLGIYHSKSGNYSKAISYYSRAIEIDPSFYDAFWNRALLYLKTGDFERGWKGYEYRFLKEDFPGGRNFSKPRWSGENISGKKILVLAEQGFGDTIQFVRYLKKIKEIGAHIIFECHKELISLFKQLDFIDEFIERGTEVFNSQFDYYVYLLSLPGIFKTDFESMFMQGGYLKADSELVKKYSHLFDKNNFNVGICWKGNPNHKNDKNRSCNFDNFRVLNIPGVKLYSLQVGDGLELGDFVFDLKNKINNFSDTAAMIANLDLIISVDTSVLHLACAMGKETWGVFPRPSEWRYFIGKNDSPWYSSLKIFEQEKKGNWKELFEIVRNELIAKV